MGAGCCGNVPTAADRRWWAATRPRWRGATGRRAASRSVRRGKRCAARAARRAGGGAALLILYGEIRQQLTAQADRVPGPCS